MSVIDLPGRKLLGKIETPRPLAGIAISPDGRTIVAVDDAEPSLFLIDTAVGRVCDEVRLEGVPKPAQIARYAPDDSLIVVTSLNSGTVSLIDASFRYRGVKQTNADVGTTAAASTGDNPKEIDRIGVASWFWTVTPKFSLEAKYNHNENHNGASPVTPFGYQPAFNAANPELVGLYSPGDGRTLGGASLAVNNDDFFRDEYKLTASYLAHLQQAALRMRQLNVGSLPIRLISSCNFSMMGLGVPAGATNPK